jgi:hypothetical protein
MVLLVEWPVPDNANSRDVINKFTNTGQLSSLTIRASFMKVSTWCHLSFQNVYGECQGFAFTLELALSSDAKRMEQLTIWQEKLSFMQNLPREHHLSF